MIALFSLALLTAATPARADYSLYQLCTTKARTAPEQALVEAERSAAEMGEASALHCKALALFELRQYDESAKLLETLYSRLGEKDAQLPLRVNLMIQVARAKALDQDTQGAKDAYAAAVALAAGHDRKDLTVETLRQRMKFLTDTKQYEDLIQDADHILSLAPTDTEALMARAGAFLALQNKDLAQADYKEILRLKPGHKDAALALKQTAGRL